MFITQVGSSLAGKFWTRLKKARIWQKQD